MSFFNAHRVTPATQAPQPASENTSPFDVKTPKIALEDIILSEVAARSMAGALARIAHHEHVFERWGLGEVAPSQRRLVINLSGPPGTGKTMCAEGIAHRLGRRLLTVSYAELESKYVGDTPKNIRSVFEHARAAGAVVFFDEADSILGRRMTSVTQSADHSVNVSRATMLTELERFEGVVVFATNLMRNYDEAFARRILTHIEFTLPDLDARRRLAARFLVDPLPRDLNVTAAWFAETSEGLSGAEMLQALLTAAFGVASRSGLGLTRADLVAAVSERRLIREGIAPIGRVSEELVDVRQDASTAST